MTILNYALTLEYLKRKFYMGGLAQFKQADFVNAGFPDPFYANLKEVYFDEMVALPLLLLDLTDVLDPCCLPRICSYRSWGHAGFGGNL